MTLANDSTGFRHWWDRPCGGAEVLRLALPLVTSLISWTVMNFTDRMFLTWYSARVMAAVMPAGMLYFTMVCFPLGVVMYVNTFVAQYEGAARPDQVRRVVWQGVWIGLLAIPLLLATIPFAPALFTFARHEPELAFFETQYFRVIVLGGGGMLIAAAFSTFFTGRGETRVVMVVDTAVSMLNIALDYAWIFGRWGFPEWGIAGAGAATAVSQWIRATVYWLLTELPYYRQAYPMDRARRLDLPLMRRVWRYGGPSGLQFLVECSAFTVFVLVVARLGEHAAAATTLAFNVNSVAFVPILGMGTAVSTMVGQQLGRNRPDLAARATWTACWLTLLYTGAIASLYLFSPGVFLWCYAAGADTQTFAGLRPIIVVLLRFVAAYSLFDALNIIFCGAIKGAGDTRFVLFTSMVISAIALASVFLGLNLLGGGLLCCWTVVTGWVCGLGLAYLARFLQGRWREMRVIEPEVFAGGHHRFRRTRNRRPLGTDRSCR